MATGLLQDAQALDKRRSGRYGTDMIEQVAKLQSDVEYIKRDVAEMKIDMREMRNEMRNEMSNEFRNVRSELRDVRNHQERDFRILFGALIATAVGLAGLSAKGFGWF